MSHQNTEQLVACYPYFFFGLCNLGVALSNVCLSDLVKEFSPHPPASAAAGEAAVSVPGSASVESVSFPSIADSTVIAGSSCNHFQCLDLSRDWDLDWGLCSGLPQYVDPVCVVGRLGIPVL